MFEISTNIQFSQTIPGTSSSETHAGDDVAIFARGQMVYLYFLNYRFSVTHKNNSRIYANVLGGVNKCI